MFSVRSPHILSNKGEGLDFIIPLLRQLFKMMNLPFVHWRKNHQVSYVLLHKASRYSFRGHPDYAVHRDDVGVEQLLVATGKYVRP